MRNWADLPPELLSLIAQKIHLYKDFFFFGLVCKPWQSATSSISDFHSPEPTRWLLLAGNEADESTGGRSFLGLTKGLTKFPLPEIRGKWCLESLGWLLTIAGDGEVSLLNPFSSVQISLPSLNGLEHFNNESGDVGTNLFAISKMVLSSNPSETENFMVFVIYRSCELLSMWRSGDSNWTLIPTKLTSSLYDIMYYDNYLYYVDHSRKIYYLDVRNEPQNPPEFLLVIECPWEFKQSYLVEGDPAELLLVIRDGIDLRFDRTRTYHKELIEVFEKGITRFKVFAFGFFWFEKRSLGNRALFLGQSGSVSVDATRLPGVKPNCIYYTDDLLPAYYQFVHPSERRMGYYLNKEPFKTGVDELVNLPRKNMVIYNMGDGTTETLFDGEYVSRVGQPIWVTPSSR